MNDALTASMGLNLRTADIAAALQLQGQGLWFEVHAENFMVEGGPRLRLMEALSARFPVSLHGVSASIGGPGRLDRQHLARLKALVERFKPRLVSEHLAWSRYAGTYTPDLLPFPRTAASLRNCVANIDQLQQVLGRQVLVENPSHYLALGHKMQELEFLGELARRSQCALLVDLSNVYVSANNLGLSATAWVDAVPAELVGEIHLAGFSPDPRLGDSLLIDSHEGAVSPVVRQLYNRLIARIGYRPTILEWDGDPPSPEDRLAELHAIRSDEPLHAEAIVL